MNRLYIHISILLSGLLMTSCSTTKLLNDNEYLYKGAKIDIEAENDIKTKPVKNELQKATSPAPNRKMAGLFPVRLWMYNLAGDSVPEKGLRNWMKHKVGEPPVLFKEYYVETSTEQIENILQNKGFFHYDLEPQKIIRQQKIKVRYSVSLERPYIIDSMSYPAVTDTLSKYISELKNNSLINKGDQYDLQLLKEERKRIDKALKTKGFYYFSPDFLYFKVDSTKGSRRMHVALRLKNDIPQEATQRYVIKDIYLHHGYSIRGTENMRDTLLSDGLHHIYEKEMNVKKEVFTNAVFFESGQYYNEKDYSQTLEKLINLGIYKFVNIRFRADSTKKNNVLDAHINLTQSNPKSVQAEFQAVSKSNDFAGPGLSLSYQDRNISHGAQHFTFSVNSGYETQFSKDKQGVNSIELGTDAELDIPRIIFPFLNVSPHINRKYSPQTRIKGGYNYFNRSGYFTANTFSLSYGYTWRSTRTNMHDLDVLSINYLETRNVDDSLKDSYIINQNFQEQFIFSLRYGFTFNDLLYSDRKTNTYFHTSVELAGNTLSLIDNTFGDRNTSTEGPSKILGIVYSQYARFITDYRLYYKLNNQQKLVGRVYAGIGIPYGNVNYLPYRKQFYTGGTTSIRAFPSRSLGPGSYAPPDSLQNELNLEQAGDIKLETNLEYRFDIIKFIKGALFVDAGNIWLMNDVKEISGGFFRSSDFLNEIAVGTGFGIRFDASFFVLRLDIAFPLRKPFLPDQERWVINDVNLLDKAWRRDNLVFNIAIGYPF